MADQLVDGKVSVMWLTTVPADTSAPTPAEVNAGTELSTWITPDGLAIELGDSSVDVSGLNSTFTASKAGRATVSIDVTFKDQGRSAAPWITFADRPTGAIVVRRNVDFDDTYANGDDVEVYEVQAGDRAPIAPASNEVSKFSLMFFSSTDPILDAEVTT